MTEHQVTVHSGVQARRRNIRVDELVEPELKAASKDLQKAENLKMIQEGAKGTQEQLNAIYRERFKKAVCILEYPCMALHVLNYSRCKKSERS